MNTSNTNLHNDFSDANNPSDSISDAVNASTTPYKAFDGVHISVKNTQIARMFGRNGSLSYYDIIAYVRRNKEGRVPDPNTPVILDTDLDMFSQDVLRNNKIYWGGEHGNLNELNKYSALENVYIPVFVDDLTDEQKESKDKGLHEICDSIKKNYKIEEFTLLLCGFCNQGIDSPIVTIAYIYRSYNIPGVVIQVTPPVREYLSLPKYAIDVSKYTALFRERRGSNALNLAFLEIVLKKIADEVQEVRDTIQKNGDTGAFPQGCSSKSPLTDDDKILLLYLRYEHGVPPYYSDIYASHYVGSHFMYDFERAALYERIMWLRGLPQVFGYIGADTDDISICALSSDALYDAPNKTQVLNSADLVVAGSSQQDSRTASSRIYPMPDYCVYFKLNSPTDIAFALTYNVTEIVGTTELDKDTSDEALRKMIMINHFKMNPQEREQYFEGIKRILPELLRYKNYGWGDEVEFVDFRRWFPYSSNYIDEVSSKVTRGNGIINSSVTSFVDGATYSDLDSDKFWQQFFMDFANTVGDMWRDRIYPTVKNCVIQCVDKEERLFLCLYCPDKLGINYYAYSEYYNMDLAPLGEEMFHHIVDIQTTMALLSKDPDVNEASITAGAARFREQMRENESNLKPILPYKITLILKLLTSKNSGLSYYDKYLRTTRNVIPIIVRHDANIPNEYKLLDFFVYPILLEGSISAIEKHADLQSITCFGTVKDEKALKQVIDVTYESFKGCELL